MVHVTPWQVVALLAAGAALAVLAMTHTAQAASRESELHLVRAQLRELQDWKRATDQTLGLNNADIQLNAQVLLQQGQVQTEVVAKVGRLAASASASGGRGGGGSAADAPDADSGAERRRLRSAGGGQLCAGQVTCSPVDVEAALGRLMLPHGQLAQLWSRRTVVLAFGDPPTPCNRSFAGLRVFQPEEKGGDWLNTVCQHDKDDGGWKLRPGGGGGSSRSSSTSTRS